MKRIWILAVLFLYFSIYFFPDDTSMSAHFVNVGQGDATLLEFPCGVMLIDAGAQDEYYVKKLIKYLNKTITKSCGSKKVIDLLIITHDHDDHILGLAKILDQFIVKRMVYNGKTISKSDNELGRVIRDKEKYKFILKSILQKDVNEEPTGVGLTSNVINPFECKINNPKVSILMGGSVINPGWELGPFNNESLVVRVDFGKSSFLFPGDIEFQGIEKLLDRYPNNLLDIDVFHVGHHGSYNGITERLVEAMSPEIAIISVGKWNFGRWRSNELTTYMYGHPRICTIELLSRYIKRSRSYIPAKVSYGSRKFVTRQIRKKIYATAWDGTIKIKAWLDGRFWITRDKNN